MPPRHFKILILGFALGAIMCVACASTTDHFIMPIVTSTSTATPLTAPTALVPTPRPTYTPIPSPISTRDCPAAGSPGLPDQPPDFSEYLPRICAFLAAGGSADLLGQVLRRWGAQFQDDPRWKVGSAWNVGSLTGHGHRDFVVIAYETVPEKWYPRGHVTVIDCTMSSCRLLYASVFTLMGPDFQPTLISTSDINGDGLPDLTYNQFISSNTRMIPFYVVTSLEWNEAQDRLVDLTGGGITIGGHFEKIADLDGDGVKELVFREVEEERYYGPPPYRMDTIVYAWDGARYSRSEDIPGGPVFRFQAIEDGDRALARDDYREALRLYVQAIQNDALVRMWMTDPWYDQSERVYLTAFARYRIMLVYLRMKDPNSADSIRRRLVTGYLTNGPDPQIDTSKPGYGFAAMADLFWQAYEPSKDMSAGCLAVIAYAAQTPDSTAWLIGDYGNGLDINIQGPRDLCPY